jgi:site-specific recombinase XerD
MDTKLLSISDIPIVCETECSKHNLSKNYSGILLTASRSLVKFMQENNFDEYSIDVGENFRSNAYSTFSRKYADGHGRLIDLLNAYVTGGKIEFKKKGIQRLFPGEFGNLAQQFIDTLNDKRIKPNTIDMYDYSLNMFSVKMDILGVTPANLTDEILLNFFSSVQNTKEVIVRTIKRFLKYLDGKELLTNKIYFEQIRPSIFRKEIIPSYYSKAEISKLEDSINRNSRVGKRDYAMLLLASRLGLRSSDIRNLKFSDIQWDKNEVHIIQYKTRKCVVLPLLEDVGMAIIDYIKNARPTTSRKEIFLTLNPPYHPIGASTFSSMTKKYMYKAGIASVDKHKGPHTLRHSLATNLLSENTSLPVISSILGHSTTDSSKPYLSIDLTSLLACSHPVLPVKDSFYEQEGGIFYV